VSFGKVFLARKAFLEEAPADQAVLQSGKHMTPEIQVVAFVIDQ